eukprot:5640600-Pyramimonas_sp.AAC.1
MSAKRFRFARLPPDRAVAPTRARSVGWLRRRRWGRGRFVSVAAGGYRVDAKGYMVDVKGYMVDAKGYIVDVKGYRVASAHLVHGEDGVGHPSERVHVGVLHDAFDQVAMHPPAEGHRQVHIPPHRRVQRVDAAHQDHLRLRHRHLQIEG